MNGFSGDRGDRGAAGGFYTGSGTAGGPGGAYVGTKEDLSKYLSVVLLLILILANFELNKIPLSSILSGQLDGSSSDQSYILFFINLVLNGLEL